METVEEVLDMNAKLGMMIFIDSKRYIYGSHIPDCVLEKEVYRWKFIHSGINADCVLQIQTKEG